LHDEHHLLEKDLYQWCCIDRLSRDHFSGAGKDRLRDNLGGYRHHARAEIAAWDRHYYGGAVLGASL
jgi:hypothetical protein